MLCALTGAAVRHLRLWRRAPHVHVAVVVDDESFVTSQLHVEEYRIALVEEEREARLTGTKLSFKKSRAWATSPAAGRGLRNMLDGMLEWSEMKLSTSVELVGQELRTNNQAPSLA